VPRLAEAADVDPLSDVLNAVRLTGAHFYCVEARAPWSIEAPRATELAPRILAESDHLISYHVVSKGRCLGGRVGDEPVELSAGDVIVFPHGDRHVMASERDVEPAARQRLEQAPPRFPVPVAVGRGRGGGPRAELVCGFLGCDRRPFNPLVETLPPVIRMRGTPDGALARFARQAAEESKAQRTGAALILTRLSELMFIEVLRRHVESLPPRTAGWLAGLRDATVARALALLHESPARAWTLAQLAETAATSRSVLAERFTRLVGQPPMQYLTNWRLQLAAGRLAQGGQKVAAVAAAVGYESEAAFSRAFTRSTGVPPSQWRRRRLGRG
jgi:AraC-like DNA-binding protein